MCIPNIVICISCYFTDVYRDNPRFPLYHTLLPDSVNVCNSFCLVSVEDQVSFQFTFPLTTPNSINETISYLMGIGSKPSDVKVCSIRMSLCFVDKSSIGEHSRRVSCCISS